MGLSSSAVTMLLLKQTAGLVASVAIADAVMSNSVIGCGRATRLPFPTLKLDAMKVAGNERPLVHGGEGQVLLSAV